MADFEGATVDDIYEAFAYAETGSFKDPWIRTTASNVRGGSNAYGPVQMLSSFVSQSAEQKTLEGKRLIDFNEKELEFIKRYEKQGQEFYRHGHMKDNLPNYNPKFDYGGSGNMSKTDKKLYENVAKKIIGYELRRTGGIYNLKRSWRGEEDSDYFKKFDKKLGQILNKNDRASLLPDETLMEKMLA